MRDGGSIFFVKMLKHYIFTKATEACSLLINKIEKSHKVLLEMESVRGCLF